MLQATAEIDIETTPEIAFGVLWDVARYPEFLSDVMDVSVQEESGRRVAVFDVRVFRARRFRVSMEREGVERLHWRLVDGEHLKSVDGQWTVQELAPGLTRLTYTLAIDLDFAIPDVIARRFTDFGLPTVLRQVKARIEAATALAH